MIDPNEAPDAATRAVHDLLHGLPPRRAPASLEARVMAELARRAALPWWRRGFAQWPAAARALFVAGSAGAVAGSMFGLPAGWETRLAALPFGGFLPPWARPLTAGLSATAHVPALILRAIPAAWLDGALAGGVLLYAALFGLGAIAYRALPPSSVGEGQLS